MPSPRTGEYFHLELRRRIPSRRLILRVLLAAALLSRPTLAYEQEVKQLSAQMAEVITKSGKKTVAVVDFTDLQGNVTELGRFLAEEFSVALSGNAKDFEVIDRTNLKTLLQEHKLASTGIIDPQTARKLGEIAGVQALITGNITPFGDSVRLSIKILDSGTARVISGFSGDIPRTKAIEELLAKGISSNTNPVASGDRPGQPSPPPITGGKAVQSLRAGDFVIEPQSCNLSGTRVNCRVLITFSKERSRTDVAAPPGGGGSNGRFAIFAEHGQLSTRIFDNAGTEYHATSVRLGTQGMGGGFGSTWAENTLVEGVPVSAWLVFENIAPVTNEITALIISCTDFLQERSLKFPNVRLSK